MMAQNAPRKCRSITNYRAVGPRLFVLGLALGLAASVGQAQPTPDTISLPDSLGSTWNDVCCLAVGNNDVRWAVGDSGRVLKMVDGDTTAGYVVGKGQYDLCGVSFADANHGWAIGNKRDEPNRGSGVIFSTRRGGSEAREWVWSCPVIRPDVNVPFLKVQALDFRHVWLTCGDGYMFYTNDGGANWAATTRGGRSDESRE